ncbi:hypothetical protein [Sphingomonas phyllosphaerae]|uniref:hypothetical protein n=1 Tax=Sphingomonas phyllosphaerae TaxID=257003 RepID=UPI0024131283|nr:hypothetical protein [Sphingomonas phyllosphaerae]
MPDERLVSEIIAETTRNPRLAAIFRSVDERLIQALSAIVPQASAAEPLRFLAETILVVSARICQRRVMKKQESPPAVMALLMDFVDREIARLAAQARPPPTTTPRWLRPRPSRG